MRNLASFAPAGFSAALALSFSTLLLGVTCQQQQTYATPVLLPHICTTSEARSRGDGREVWVNLLPDGRTLINNDLVARSALSRGITTLMATRNEPAVTLVAAGNLSYSAVAQAINDLRSGFPDTTVILVTTSQLVSAGRYPCLVFSLYGN